MQMRFGRGWRACADAGRGWSQRTRTACSATPTRAKHRARAAYRWAVDTTVYVDESARRGGLGRSLYRELFRILTRQGFSAAYAGIALPNDASVGLHKAVGFEFVAVYPAVGFKLGRWYDVSWWRRTLNERAHTRRPNAVRRHRAVRRLTAGAVTPVRLQPFSATKSAPAVV